MNKTGIAKDNKCDIIFYCNDTYQDKCVYGNTQNCKYRVLKECTSKVAQANIMFLKLKTMGLDSYNIGKILTETAQGEEKREKTPETKEELKKSPRKEL